MYNSLKTLIEEVIKTEFSSILLEKKRQKPQVMFHGTSSKFLSKIFQLGVIPNPNSGRWKSNNDSDLEDTSIWRPSLRSLEGSYWTSNLTTAYSAAGNAARTLGGNKLLIVANIIPQTGKSDEDDIRGIVEKSYGNSIAPWFGALSIDNSAWSLKGMVEAEKFTNSGKVKEMISQFEKNLHERLKTNDKMPVDHKMMKRAFFSTLERLLGHIDITTPNNSHEKWRFLEEIKRNLQKTRMPKEEVDKIIEGYKNNLPKYSKAQGEKNFLKILDVLSGRYRKFTKINNKDIISSFQTNIRVPTVVGFSGRNKIIAIFELEYPDNEKKLREKIIQVYGNSIPEIFIQDWNNFNGELIVYNKSGEIIYNN